MDAEKLERSVRKTWITRFFSREEPPQGRPTFWSATAVLLSVIESQWGDRNVGADVIFLSVGALLWGILAIRRLIDLRISLVWFAPVCAPFALASFLIFIGPQHYPDSTKNLVLIAVFLSQLPLLLLPPHKAPTSNEPSSPELPEPGSLGS
jgi:hypothetical protein